MRRPTALSALAFLVLAACGDQTPKQQSAGASPPMRTACTTPEQAGQKAQDITRKLVEAKKQGTISEEQYVGYNNTFSQGLRVWGETQSLAAYCATLDRIATDAGLK